MANHHPAPELLTAFSAGSLQLSHALCVATHIESCHDCNANLNRLNTVGAQLMSDLKPAAASDELKNKVLDMLDDTPAAMETRVSKPSVVSSAVPRALRQFIPTNYDALEWSYVSPSIEAAKLCVDKNGSKVELLRLKPGSTVPTHTHTGDEYTLLLEGSFSDESGIYQEGDFVIRDGRHKHRPVVTKDKVCICLTVTDAPIQFTGFFTRWLNPLIRRGHLA